MGRSTPSAVVKSKHSAHRDIRRIGVKNENLVWLWVNQGHRLGEGAIKVLEGLLASSSEPLFGQCRK